MTSHKASAWLVLLAVLAAPSSAWAHIQAGEVGGFVSGFHHPISRWDRIGIALSALVLGVMVLSEKRPPLWVAAVIVGVFAIFHGHAHGTELPAGQSGLLYSMGFVMATGCLHGVGVGVGLIHRWTAGRVILRMAGSTVAVAGMYFLFSALTWHR
jgi:urease accessory protein